MEISLSQSDLLDYLVCQLKTFFPDKKDIQKDEIRKNFDEIIQRTEFCFSKVNNKYFKDNSSIIFNHLHTDQYAMFLYFASNTLYRNNSDLELCTKIFQLNKFLNALDVFYEVELPDIFLFVHPLGTVLGRAKYSNYFLVYQRCNIGSNHDIYPSLSEHVSLHPGASILGNCKVEENCKISAGSLLMDSNLEKNSIYIGNPNKYKIKTSKKINPIWKQKYSIGEIKDEKMC